jgi:hypothetical protein
MVTAPLGNQPPIVRAHAGVETPSCYPSQRIWGNLALQRQSNKSPTTHSCMALIQAPAPHRQQLHQLANVISAVGQQQAADHDQRSLLLRHRARPAARGAGAGAAAAPMPRGRHELDGEYVYKPPHHPGTRHMQRAAGWHWADGITNAAWAAHQCCVGRDREDNASHTLGPVLCMPSPVGAGHHACLVIAAGSPPRQRDQGQGVLSRSSGWESQTRAINRIQARATTQRGPRTPAALLPGQGLQRAQVVLAQGLHLPAALPVRLLLPAPQLQHASNHREGWQ